MPRRGDHYRSVQVTGNIYKERMNDVTSNDVMAHDYVPYHEVAVQRTGREHIVLMSSFHV